MKTRSYGVALLPVVVALLAGTVLSTLHPGIARAANCIPNVNGNNQSAALVNPASFSGILNATGCDFGIYVSEDRFSTITNATIVGAKVAAIDVDFDATANVSHSTVVSPLLGIALGGLGPGHGMISDNSITAGYCGVCVGHVGSTATIMNNVIKGLGNPSLNSGILAGNGASSVTISNNTLINNDFGMEIFPDAGIGYTATGNLLKNNEIGIYVLSGTGSLIEANRVEVGLDGSAIGIHDNGGTNDQIVKNFICAYATPINTQGAINPIVAGNVIHATCP